jgi:hypothetical protein
MNKQRSYLFVVAALGIAIIALGAGIAGAEKPVKSKVGSIETEFNGGFTPKALSKKKATPVTFDISGKIRSVDPAEPHPPAIREFVVEGDKHATIDVKGIPVCTSGKLQATDTVHARKACGPALIGTGKTEAGVKFPEQPEVIVKSDLLVFNGGSKGGVTTLYIHAFFSSPINGAIVTTVKIKKVHHGRYGLESVASIPKLANGAGSVKSFSLTLNKGIISASCPDGHLNARGTAVFADGLRASGAVVRTCTGKG